jgi:hypothetical protein
MGGHKTISSKTVYPPEIIIPPPVIDLTDICILQALCQDNDASPAIRNNIEPPFVFLNSDNGFDNASAWTCETGWSVSGSYAVSNYPITHLIYQPSTVYNGRSYFTSFELVSRISGGCAVYIGGGIGTYRTVPGIYTQYVTGGSSNQFVGFKNSTPCNFHSDNIYIWDRTIYPRTSYLNGSQASTSLVHSSPGHVQPSCFNFIAGSKFYYDQPDIYPFIQDLVFWINPNSLSTRQGIIRFGSGLDIVLDSDGKIKFFASGFEYPMDPDNHFFIKVNNGSGNQLLPGWNLVWIGLYELGQQLKGCQFFYQQTNYFAGKFELIEAFGSHPFIRFINSDDISFLWNDGIGTTLLKNT